MSRFVDTLVAYRILRMLSTSIEDSDAYRLGIINSDGEKLKSPVTTDELNAYSFLNRFVFKVQKALTKSNDRQAKRLLSFAAAMAILREYKEEDDDMDVATMLELFEQDDAVIEEARLMEKDLLSFRNFNMKEEMAANSAGAGGVDGIGIGAKGEPGKDAVMNPMVRRKKKKDGKVIPNA